MASSAAWYDFKTTNPLISLVIECTLTLGILHHTSKFNYLIYFGTVLQFTPDVFCVSIIQEVLWTGYSIKWLDSYDIFFCWILLNSNNRNVFTSCVVSACMESSNSHLGSLREGQLGSRVSHHTLNTEPGLALPLQSGYVQRECSQSRHAVWTDGESRLLGGLPL